MRSAHRRLAAWTIVAVAAGVDAFAQPTSDRGIRLLEDRVKADPADFIAWNRLGVLFLLRHRETGDDAWLDRGAQAAEASLKSVAAELNAAGLMLEARVDLAEHRFAAARERAQQLREMQAANSEPLAILGDALLELGEMDEGARLFTELAERDGPSVGAESRLARVALLRGRHDDARAHLSAALEAARQIEPTSPVTVAWCQVQLGDLAFRTGRWDNAEGAYQAALAAMPGWWSAREHLAELRGAQERDAEALALYQQAIEKAARPEVMQALGDLHLFRGRKDEARHWHERARAAYLDSVGKGKVLYVHHLAGFYSDSQPDAAEAVKWARRDLELRKSPAAWDALAWALYKQGDIAAALHAARKSLATGIADPHVLYHAGMIHISADAVTEGQALLRRCAEVNPRFNTFHAHR